MSPRWSPPAGSPAAPAPGGSLLGGFGPAPAGLALWLLGLVAALGLALWLGARSCAAPPPLPWGSPPLAG
ncbi:hypothetical protein C3R44_23465, partial [Mycobacterium tuberculosis]